MNSISQWCGRFGNNIQQISNAIYYCKEKGLNFNSPDNELVNSFGQIFGDNNCHSALYFFHIPSKLGHGRPDFEINNLESLFSERREICQKYIYPNLKINFENIIELPEDTVVMHIRSGDIFSRRNYYCPVVSNYLQNPLSYYTKIAEKYNRIIVLTEDYNNPVISELEKNEKIEIKILDITQTIEIMLSAKNIVTSGVSSFAIACVLLSKNIKKMYCSNLVVEEILNQRDLQDTKVEIEVIGIDTERYIRWNEWLNTDEQRKLMLEYVL
jgi:hypothetical protein